MYEQELNTQEPADQRETPPMLRRTWERPVLQRLPVSLDTAETGGNGGDVLMPGGLLKPLS